MEDTLVIDTVDKLKVFADPLRQRLLKAFCCKSSTVKLVAQQMNEKPARLYHHVDLLEQNGFLEIVDTRQIRGTIEKYYQTVARKVIVDHALVGSLEEEAPDVKNLVMNTIQACLVDARDHFDDQPKAKTEKTEVILAQEVLRLTPSQLSKFEAELKKLVDDIHSSEGTGEEPVEYSFTAACFPIKRGACC